MWESWSPSAQCHRPGTRVCHLLPHIVPGHSPWAAQGECIAGPTHSIASAHASKPTRERRMQLNSLTIIHFQGNTCTTAGVYTRSLIWSSIPAGCLISKRVPNLHFLVADVICSQRNRFLHSNERQHLHTCQHMTMQPFHRFKFKQLNANSQFFALPMHSVLM